MTALRKDHRQFAATFLTYALAAFVFLGAGADYLPAQYSTSQGGHLLDANPRIGSGGLNSPTNPNPRLLGPGFNNLLITGNVTGGRSFQGDIGYRSPYEFQGGLGSTELSNFRRDSVGQADLSVDLNRPRPYLSPSRGVTRTLGGNIVNTGDLLGGNTAAVGSMLRQQTIYQSPLAKDSINGGIGGFNVDSFATPPGYESTGYVPPAQKTPWVGQGLPGSPEQPQPKSPNPFAQHLGSYLRREIPRTEPSPAPTEAPSDQPPPQENPYEQGLIGSEADAAEAPNPNTDFLRQFQTIKTPVDTTATPEPDLFVPPPPIGFTGQYYDDKARLYRSYLAKGEKLMRQQKYHHAANAFSQAMMHTTDKSPAYLAKSLALFGAGDFAAAASTLDKALKLSPKLAGKKFSLRRFFPRYADAAKRLNELSNLHMQVCPDNLLLLTAYIQYQLNLHDLAKETLAHLNQRNVSAMSFRVLSHAVNDAKQAADRELHAVPTDSLPKYDDLPTPPGGLEE